MEINETKEGGVVLSPWDEETDFIAVGSGGGGLCAAFTAQANGAAAIVLEKRALVGGSTAMSGGILWAPSNDLMREAGVDDSPEEALRYFEAAVRDGGAASSPQRRRAYVAEINEMIRFLGKKGIPWKLSKGYSDYHDLLDGGKADGRGLIVPHFNLKRVGQWRKRFPPRRGRYKLAASSSDFADLNLMVRTWRGFFTAVQVLTRTVAGYALGQEPAGAGAALVGRMLELCLQSGVDVRLETALEEFVVEDGRVVGVIASQGGRVVRIRARRGVLIAAGGYSRNVEMRQSTGPHPASVDWTSAHEGDTGEVIQIAQFVGAAVSNMDDAWWVPSTMLPSGRPQFLIGERSKPNCIMVDQSGNRFVNEAASYMTVGQAMYARNREVPSIPSWFIIDARHRRRYLWGTALPGVTPRAWVRQGYLVKAHTLDDLAGQCGLDPVALHATVKRFNDMARTGVDRDFQKGASAYDRYYGDPRTHPNPCLGTIEYAPFYAARVYPGDAGTSGGLLTDERGRVLREAGTPIPGLYATGNSTASISGHTYIGPGITIGATFVFGYIAAKDALGLPSATTEVMS
ncbi:MAG: FAD-dependent oxidoreductase [Actinomycetota bacterium]